jgi:uncharacterized protein (TIGR03546 family)
MLHSENGTNQIALGLSLGFILGISPFLSLQTLIVLSILFLFRIQVGAAFLAAFFFKFLAYLLDPVFHSIGSSVLRLDSLKGVFTYLYNLPIVPYTRFNNSIVMGEMVVGFILIIPMFFLFRFLIVKYHYGFEKYINNLKLVKTIKATKVYGWYSSYMKYYGD